MGVVRTAPRSRSEPSRRRRLRSLRVRMGLQATVMEGVQGPSRWVSGVITGVQGPSWWVSRVITGVRGHHSVQGHHSLGSVTVGVQVITGVESLVWESGVRHGGWAGAASRIPSLQSPHPLWWPCFPRDAPGRVPGRVPCPGSGKRCPRSWFLFRPKAGFLAAKGC